MKSHQLRQKKQNTSLITSYITLIQIILTSSQIYSSNCSSYGSSQVPFKTSFVSSSDYTLRTRNGAILSFPMANGDEVARLTDTLMGDPELSTHLEAANNQGDSHRTFESGHDFPFARQYLPNSRLADSSGSHSFDSTSDLHPNFGQSEDLMQSASSAKSGTKPESPFQTTTTTTTIQSQLSSSPETTQRTVWNEDRGSELEARVEASNVQDTSRPISAIPTESSESQSTSPAISNQTTDSSTESSNVTRQSENQTVEITVNLTTINQGNETIATTVATPAETIATEIPKATTTTPINPSESVTNMTDALLTSRANRADDSGKSFETSKIMLDNRPTSSVSIQIQGTRFSTSCPSGQTNCSFLITSVPILETLNSNPSDNSKRLNRTQVVNEFIIFPQEPPLTLDESSYSVRTDANLSTSELKAEHRGIDDSEDASASDDLELDYINSESDRAEIDQSAKVKKEPTTSTSTSTTETPARFTLATSSKSAGSYREKIVLVTPAPKQSHSRHHPTLKARTSHPIIFTSTGPVTSSPSAQTTVKPADHRAQHDAKLHSGSMRSTSNVIEEQKRSSASTNAELTSVVVKPSQSPSIVLEPKLTSTEPPRMTTKPSSSINRRLHSQWPRNRQGSQEKQQSAREHSGGFWRNFSPMANGADEEEARILTRYSIPSQLSRLNHSLVTRRVPEKKPKVQQSLDSRVSIRLSDSESTEIRSGHIDFAREKIETRSKPTFVARKPETTSIAPKITSTSMRPVSSTPGILSRTIEALKQVDMKTTPSLNLIDMTTSSSNPASKTKQVSSAPSTTSTPSIQPPSSTKIPEPSQRISKQIDIGDEIMTLIADTAQKTPAKAFEGTRADRSGVTQSASNSDFTIRKGDSLEGLNKGVMKTQQRNNSYVSKRKQADDETNKRRDDARLRDLLEELAQLEATDKSSETPQVSTELSITKSWTDNLHQAAIDQSQIREKTAGIRIDSGKWNPMDVSGDWSGASSTQANDLLPGRPGIDYPINWQVPKTSFDCRNFELSGFYADVESNCQAYHSCHKGRGGQHSFLCPNGTLFSQELLTCDWWYNVECSNTSGSKLASPNSLDKSFLERPANELSAS